MALMLVVVCLLVHIRYQPFLHDTSDKLEFISLFISFLTFFFGLILFSSEVRDYARVVISFIIVALNLLFVLYSGYLIVRAAIEYFRDRLHAARLEEQELQSAAVAQQKSVQPCVEIQTDSGSANQQNSMVTPHAHLSDAKPIVSDVHSSLSPHAQRDLRRVAVDDFVPQLDTKVDTVIVEESEQDQQAVKSGFVNEIELTLTSNVLFDRVQVVDVSAAPDNTLSDVLVDADPSQGHAAESTDVQQVEHSSDQSSENEVEIAVKSIAEPSPQGATPHVDEIESEYSADNHVVKDIELASQHSAEIHIESHNISDYEASQTEEHSEIVDASSSDPDQTTVQNQVVSAEAVEPIQKELATSSNALTAITLNRTVSVGIQNPHFAEIALSSTSEESFAAEEEPRHDDDSEELENSDH
jgi:hypothetical protein